jgi:hypothetical protein
MTRLLIDYLVVVGAVAHLVVVFLLAVAALWWRRWRKSRAAARARFEESQAQLRATLDATMKRATDAVSRAAETAKARAGAAELERVTPISDKEM